MSLMKLLTVSKSFAGGQSHGRYKMAEQGLLPKFATMGRPVSLAPNRPAPGPGTATELRSADFSPHPSSPAKTAGSGLKSALLSCHNSLNSMAVGPGAESAPGSSPSQRQFSKVAEPSAKPVRAIPPTSQVSGGNAIAAPTNWFRPGAKPFSSLPAGRLKAVSSAQAELSLEAVKPVRNDLSDSDLQIVPAKLEIKPAVSKPARARLLRPELTGLAWSRLTAKFFDSERVRA